MTQHSFPKPAWQHLWHRSVHQQMQTAQISREFSRLTEGYKIQYGSSQKNMYYHHQASSSCKQTIEQEGTINYLSSCIKFTEFTEYRIRSAVGTRLLKTERLKTGTSRFITIFDILGPTGVCSFIPVLSNAFGHYQNNLPWHTAPRECSQATALGLCFLRYLSFSWPVHHRFPPILTEHIPVS